MTSCIHRLVLATLAVGTQSGMTTAARGTLSEVMDHAESILAVSFVMNIYGHFFLDSCVWLVSNGWHLQTTRLVIPPHQWFPQIYPWQKMLEAPTTEVVQDRQVADNYM